jgi:hypothetical protein
MKAREAKAQPKTVMHGRIIRLAGYRSRSNPRGGEQTATVIAAMPKAMEADSRDQPNSAVMGFRKTLKV